MKYLIRFDESRSKTVKLKKSKFLFDDGYKVDYEFYLGSDYIGMCQAVTTFKLDNFDPTKDSFFCTPNRFDFKNPVKKSDYNKYTYFILIYGFEIEDEFKGKGLGKLSFSKLLEDLSFNFPNNSGIILSVFEDNKPAIKIYKDLGFEVINVENKILVMKK
jgi:GNAT superfamily N-acetyltransferase